MEGPLKHCMVTCSEHHVLLTNISDCILEYLSLSINVTHSFVLVYFCVNSYS